MKSLNIINQIHDNEVNNIAECNLLHDIPNLSKRIKNINIHLNEYACGGIWNNSWLYSSYDMLRY